MDYIFMSKEDECAKEYPMLIMVNEQTRERMGGAVGHKGSLQPRNVQSDLFTILLLIYHMVQWMKVNKTIGQSEIDDLE